MRLAFVTRSLDVGGAERQLVTLALGLERAGHSVLVVTFYPGGLLEPQLREAGIAVRTLGKRGRWDVTRFLVDLARLLRDHRPDVVHTFLGMPNILSALLRPVLADTRIVWGMRTSDIDLAPYDWFIRLQYRVEPWVSRFADLIIANSRAGSRRAVSLGFPEKKVIVIPNGIDTDAFRPDPAAGQRARAEWGVPDGAPLVGLVARLDPVKDHPGFLAAAARLGERRPDARFVCVGDGPPDYAERLRERGRALGLAGRLTWAGARRDVAAVYNALDVACCSSTAEGFPNAVGEAMACGVPCAVTDVGDAAWIVGDTGPVVAPRDTEGLGTALAGLLDARSPELATRVRDRIVGQFSQPLLVERTAAALERLVDG